MTCNREYIRIGFFAISFLLILSASVAGWSQGGGRETPKPTPPKPPVSRPATPARKNKPAFRPTNPKIELVKIPSGSFMMGSTQASDEKPVHRVTINYLFYMGKYEITQSQWQAVMGNNPSIFEGCGNCPVESVSWNEVQIFIRRLNEMSEGYTYRLPTEAEWEYACRAGTTTAFALGDSLGSNEANFDGNYPYGGAAKGVYRQKTIPVGSFRPNDWGLFDMHGNVWEWCEDWYNETYYGAPTDGSAWLSAGEQKYPVLRGGSWNRSAYNLRSANREGGRYALDGRFPHFGFRVVAVARTR